MVKVLSAKPNLLDVNVLFALTWPKHLHHHDAQTWFQSTRSAGFRTCPLTQLGFVRLSSNPAVSRDAVSPRTALDMLSRIVALPEHEFWEDNMPLSSAIGPSSPVVGHKQLTDAYLLGLSRVRGGRLATFDRGIASLLQGEDLAQFL